MKPTTVTICQQKTGKADALAETLLTRASRLLTLSAPDMNDPSEELRTRAIAYLEKTEIAASKLATITGVGYYKIHRWLGGRVIKLSYNDAVRIEKYLSQEGA